MLSTPTRSSDSRPWWSLKKSRTCCGSSRSRAARGSARPPRPTPGGPPRPGRPVPGCRGSSRSGPPSATCSGEKSKFTPVPSLRPQSGFSLAKSDGPSGAGRLGLEQVLQRRFADLLGPGAWQLVDKADLAGNLVVGQPFPGPADQLVLGDLYARLQEHDRGGNLTLAGVGDPDDGRFRNGGMLTQGLFDLDREDGVPAVLHDILLPARELEEPTPALPDQVAGP